MDSRHAFHLRALRPLEIALVDAVVREAGPVCRATDDGRQVDVHLDDAARSLARAGIALSLREDRRGRHLVSGPRGPRNGDPAAHEAHEVPWVGAQLPQTAQELPVALRDAVEPFVLDRPLGPVLRLEKRRETRVLESEGNDVCELAIERVDASAAGRTATFFEVGIDVLDDAAGSEHLAQVLQQRLPLEPAHDDPTSHATLLLGIPLPDDSAAIDDDTPIAEAVTASARRHLDAVRVAEVFVRDGRDPVHLHSMRVATRRLRSLVGGFRDLWPADSSTWLLEQLGAFGRRLGACRDLDVMLDALPDGLASLPAPLQHAAEPVATWIRDQRDAEHRQLQTWLRSGERLATGRELERRLAAVDPTGAGTATVAAAVPARLAKAVARVRKLAAAIAPELPLEPAHELRIACKRLRCLAEEFEVLQASDYGKSLRAVVRLQQALGAVCDHGVAVLRLLGWLQPAAAASTAVATTAAVLGGLATRHALLAQKARKKAARCLSRTDKKKVWRRFPDGEGGDDPAA